MQYLEDQSWALRAVQLLGLFRRLPDVEGIGRLHLHPEGEFKGLNPAFPRPALDGEAKARLSQLRAYSQEGMVGVEMTFSA